MNKSIFFLVGLSVARMTFAELSATKPEIVIATFATAEEAEKSQIAIAPIFGGRQLAFTSRWDDSTPAHVERAEMFKRVGMQPMFFLNGGNDFVNKCMPKIKECGGRFGNHSVSHPFLMESGVNKMFTEVLRQKIFVETSAEMPNTSFVIPFSWSCQLEPGRAAKLAKILVDAGIFVSSDWPLKETEQPASEWMPGNTFGANDGAPDDNRFWKGITNGIEAVAKDPDYPKITFGIHSWCNTNGVLKQEGWLKQVIAEHADDWWVTDDAHYGAYRYEFWHSTMKKIGVKGNVATFEVMRHDPAFLGEVQPLTYTFGEVTPISVATSGGFAAETAMPEKIDVMKDGASVKFPELKLELDVDEKKGTLGYCFTGGADVIAVVINPCPMWSNGRIVETAAAKTVGLGEKNTIPDYQEGEHLYVVGVDFIKDGKRGRLYATETIPGEKSAVGGTPRDCTLVLGPLDAEGFDEAKWAALSTSDTVLPNVGDSIHQYWRSMADKNRCGFSAASYIPWESREPADFKEALKYAKPADRPLFLAAVDFMCDEDGEKDLLINRAKWEKTDFYLNGEITHAKGGEFRIPVKKGRNRIIYRWEWFQPWHPKAFLLSVCDDRSVDKAVKFVTPRIQKRAGVFTSDGFSVEFRNDGLPRPPTYAGEPFLEGIGFDIAKMLLTNGVSTVKPVYTEVAGKLVCTTDYPYGAKGENVSYKTIFTVTKDSFAFEGSITVREGTAWKGILATTTIFTPITFFAGRNLKLTGANGEVTEFAYPYDFDLKTCTLPGFRVLDNGEWILTIEDGQKGMYYDRRQWGHQSGSLQVCPVGAIQWHGMVSDGSTYTWKWTLKKK